jgi:hypothetical protein
VSYHPSNTVGRNLLSAIPVERTRADLSRMRFQDFIEEVQVLGRDLVEKVKSLIHEGNVQRIIIKDDHGNTFMEIPVTFAAIGVIAAPVLAAVGAISVLVAKFTVVVERSGPPPAG